MSILGKPVVYIHAPKCGGTTIGSALRLRYAYSQATIPLPQSTAITRRLWPDATGNEAIYREHEVRDVLMADHLRKGVKCLSAHIRFNPALRRTAPGYTFATLLREPTSRFISHYYYSLRRFPETERARSIDDFLDTAEALRYGSMYLFYFSMKFQAEAVPLAEHITSARENLASFDLVGTLENLDTFQARLESKLGVKIYPITRNTKPAGEKPPKLTAEQRTRIEELCAPDIEIYQLAQELQARTA